MEESNKQTTKFQLIDILKFIFAILIFILHTGIVENGNLFTQLVIRLGVPFFFIASGFFFYRKLCHCPETEEWAVTWKAIKRLLLFLLVFEPISLLIEIVKWRVNDGLTFAQIGINSLKSIVFYPEGALWYIQGTIVAFLLVFLVVKTKKMFLIICIGLPLYFVGLLMNNYFFLISGTSIGSFVDRVLNLIISPRNGLFFGFLFVGIGALIWKHYDRLTKNIILPSILLVIFFGLFIVEVLLLKGKEFRDDRGLFLSLITVTSSLFILALSVRKNVVRDSTIYRNLSTTIYLLHPPIVSATYYALKFIDGRKALPISPIPLTLIVSSIILVTFIFILYKFKPKHIFNLVK